MPVAPASNLPLAYLRIKYQLEALIDREWPAGTRLPAMPQLAKQLGTGQSNTHRAVKALVDDGKLISRRGAGTFVAPVDGELSAQTRIIAQGDASAVAGKQIVIAGSSNVPVLMVSSMLEHAAEVLRDRGANVMVRGLDLHAVNGKVPTDCDGIIVVNPDIKPTVRFADHQLLTVISTRSDVSVAASTRYDVVSVDQEQAGYLAGEWARGAGAVCACFVGVHTHRDVDYDATGMMRLRGFEQGFGRSIEPQYRIQRDHYGPKNGALAARAFVKLDPRPDVVFCASDELAIGFALGASSHGLDPGHDFRLIGFDRQQFGLELRGDVLTTVEVPAAEMGRRAGKMLASRFEEPDQPVRRLALGCTLVEGTT